MAVTVTVSTLAIVACGSSSHPKANGANGSPAGIKFAACMRAHGLPSFPDPSGGGGIQIPASINPASPAFKSAQSSCAKLLPGGGPGGGAPATEQQKTMMLRLSQCMRAHGVSDFPDPVTSPPANPAGARLGFGRPGAFIIVPDTINISSPAFKSAAKTCHLPGA